MHQGHTELVVVVVVVVVILCQPHLPSRETSRRRCHSV
jgi:Sec-independent protein translocase protein TatA